MDAWREGGRNGQMDDGWTDKMHRASGTHLDEETVPWRNGGQNPTTKLADVRPKDGPDNFFSRSHSVKKNMDAYVQKLQMKFK